MDNSTKIILKSDQIVNTSFAKDLRLMPLVFSLLLKTNLINIVLENWNMTCRLFTAVPKNMDEAYNRNGQARRVILTNSK